jgi:hypothetical protein
MLEGCQGRQHVSKHELAGGSLKRRVTLVEVGPHDYNRAIH